MNTEILENEYRKIWGHDTNMIDYCIKKTACMLELEGGYIFTLDKPSIKTVSILVTGKMEYQRKQITAMPQNLQKMHKKKIVFLLLTWRTLFPKLKKLWKKMFLCG